LLATGRRPSRSGNDKYVAMALRFQRAWLKGSPEQVERRFAKTAPGLFEAYDLYANSAESHRWELEARLLAAEPADAIAKKMCLPAGAVEWFEALFFNIEDRRENRSYILHHAIGYPPGGQLKPAEIGVLWKQLAYTGGPLVLDALIYGSTPVSRPTQPAGVRGFLHGDVIATLQSKALLAVRMLRPDDPKVALKILRLHLRLTELANRQQRKMGEYHDIMVNMQTFARQLDAAKAFGGDMLALAKRMAGQAGPIPQAAASSPEDGQARAATTATEHGGAGQDNIPVIP